MVRIYDVSDNTRQISPRNTKKDWLMSFLIAWVMSYTIICFLKESSRLADAFFYRGGHIIDSYATRGLRHWCNFHQKAENLIMSLNSELMNPSRHPRRCIWGELCWISEPPCKILTLLQSFNGSIYYLRQSGLKYWQARQWLVFLCLELSDEIPRRC